MEIEGVVSIRDADFLLFEPRSLAKHGVYLLGVSIRDADFLLFEPQRAASEVGVGAVSIRDADFLLFEPRERAWMLKPNSMSSFNPRCGFFAVRTPRSRTRILIGIGVSIRDADFLLFELCYRAL